MGIQTVKNMLTCCGLGSLQLKNYSIIFSTDKKDQKLRAGVFWGVSSSLMRDSLNLMRGTLNLDRLRTTTLHPWAHQSKDLVTCCPSTWPWDPWKAKGISVQKHTDTYSEHLHNLETHSSVSSLLQDGAVRTVSQDCCAVTRSGVTVKFTMYKLSSMLTSPSALPFPGNNDLKSPKWCRNKNSPCKHGENLRDFRSNRNKRI